MFERPQTDAERAILVHLGIGATWSAEALEEFRELARAAGATAVGEVTGSRAQPDSRYFVGTGKLEEVQALIQSTDADLVLVDHELAPGQERNLERSLNCRVLDRTGLILDIFAQRARSFEGKLQVELAQLTHLSTRLIRGWTHLERQKGGIGLRGPGETQLELDRRMLGGRIKQIRRRLSRVQRQRGQGRQARQAAEAPTISLVGYTNAGKSSLFRSLVEPDAHVADQLFATLDPTLRRLALPYGHDAVIADTVGFLRDLPHALIEAFQSTLEETRDATLLLHVIDAADDNHGERMDDVETVLAEIGAREIARLEVFNKIDRFDGAPRIERDEHGLPRRVWLSAATGAGIELLRDAVAECLGQGRLHGWIRIAPEEGKLRARLHQEAAVLRESVASDGVILLELTIDPVDWQRVAAAEGVGGNRLCSGDAARVAGTA